MTIELSARRGKHKHTLSQTVGSMQSNYTVIHTTTWIHKHKTKKNVYNKHYKNMFLCGTQSLGHLHKPQAQEGWGT